ncbi:MAG: hypothetical protein CTY15_02260 [Methylocystis sp.]|nr:MAG: hypothetical protein CTY15_02260 [Methylocystis sp.]
MSRRLTLPPLVAQARLSPLMALILLAIAAVNILAAIFAFDAVMGPMGAKTDGAAPDWKAPTLAIVELDPPKAASADAQALTRPIFSKTRKPSPRAARPEGAATAASSAAMGVSVAAIVKKGKGAAQAFVISADAPEGAWKKVGDAVDAWAISDISADALKLRSGDGAATVKLYADPPPAPPPPQPQPSRVQP